MNRLLISVLYVFAFFLATIQQAYANDGAVYRRSQLVLDTEFRMNTYHAEDSGTPKDMDIIVSVGLDWPGFRYVSIQAMIGMGAVIGFYDDFKYRYNNQILSSRALGSIHLKAFVELHTADRWISLIGAIHGQMAFVNGRSGIFTIEAGPGISVRPFDQRHPNVLRSVAFRLMVWFNLTDDFEKVFDLQRDLVTPSIGLMLAF